MVAMLSLELQIYGEQFRRPYCNIEDLYRECVLVLESDSKKVDNKVFGMVNTNEDYQIIKVIEILDMTVNIPNS